MKKRVMDNGVGSSGESPRRKFWHQCSNVLIIIASYQLFSLFITPAMAQIRDTSVNDHDISRGDTGCKSATSSRLNPQQENPPYLLQLAQAPPREAAQAGGEQEAPANRVDANKLPLHILKEAKNLSVQGDKYYQAGQWKLATEAYRAALEKLPDDGVLRHNYELAAAHLAAEGRRGGRRKAREPMESAESPSPQATAEAARKKANGRPRNLRPSSART